MDHLVFILIEFGLKERKKNDACYLNEQNIEDVYTKDVIEDIGHCKR